MVSSLWLISIQPISVTHNHPHAATDAEIGAAESYKVALVFSHNLGPNVAPAWVAALQAQFQNSQAQLQNSVNQLQNSVNQLQKTVNVMQADVTTLLQKADELPILLANSQA